MTFIILNIATSCSFSREWMFPFPAPLAKLLLGSAQIKGSAQCCLDKVDWHFSDISQNKLQFVLARR